MTLWLVVWLGCGFAGGPEVVRGVPDVVDADTFRFDEVRVRLHAIDAPELDQPCWAADGSRYACGQRVTQALKIWLGDRSVTCVRQDTDRYGRMVARCFVGSIDIGRMLVRGGGAVAYVRYGADYADDEAWARAKLRGVWAGHVDAPERWRRLDKAARKARVHEIDTRLRDDPSGATVVPLE